MSEYQEASDKCFSISSSDNRDSTESSETRVSFEEFYEKIEAPKFVDFTVQDNYRPDDRYWFCSRVGCDQKHEEEMDSEEIYKNFVLRVMAARSPNIRLKRALDRNASRTPGKCPLSAPPKSSKPRLSKMVIASSISEKMNNAKKKFVRPLLIKPGSTPLTKVKPVAAKYLTTPRNKNRVENQSSFRSVRSVKTTNTEVSKSRAVVAKTLSFNSPKKVKKLNCNDQRRPVRKLCEEMGKLEISRKKKVAFCNSGKLCKSVNGNNTSKRQISDQKSKDKPEETHKSDRSTERSEIIGNLSKHSDPPKNIEVMNVEETKQEEAYASSVNGKDLASTGDISSDGNNLISPDSTQEEIHNNTSGTENNRLYENNLAEMERDRYERIVDSDDKENDAASDHNRIQDENSNQNGRKPFGMRSKPSQLKKVAAQAKEKNLKEAQISSSPVVKLNKLKTTNPKPFRLRTDERGILKEATLEKRTDPVAPQTEGSNISTPNKKLLRQQEYDIQKGNKILCQKTIPLVQEKSKLAPTLSKHHDEQRVINSPGRNNAMQRLEKFRKTTGSPLSKKSSFKPEGLETKPTNKKMVYFLVPGQKLEVIHETASPEVSDIRKLKKINGDDCDDDQRKAAASRSLSPGKKPVTIGNEPNFHSVHFPRSCTKKPK